MSLTRRACCTALFLLLAASGVAADEKPTLHDAVSAWVGAADDDARGAAALQVLGHQPKAADLVAALQQGFAPPAGAPTGQTVMWPYKTDADKQHTIFAFAPSSYDAKKPMPLMIWLHGGVGRGPDGGGQSGLRLWQETAEEKGFLVLSPSARPGAVWWDVAGVKLVRAALREMGRRYHVDPKRIAIGGFSDGGSACYHLLASDPTPFACMFALSGNPMVARLMGGPTHAANLTSRPVFATHGGKDSLYPTERMKPYVDEMLAAGATITWKDLPEAKHDWTTGVQPLKEEMLAFWEKHPRGDAPKSVSWQSAVPGAYGRLEWVEIVALDAKAAGDDTLTTTVIPHPPIPDPRPRLGIRIDTEFEGPGIRILNVESGTPAGDSGMQAGDVLVEVDGKEMAAPRDVMALRTALQTLTAEARDGVFVLQRGEDRVEVKTRPRSLESDRIKLGPGYGTEPGRVEATVTGPNAITVRTKGVARFKLHLDPSLVDLGKAVKVTVNGKVRHDGVVPANPAYILTEAHRLGRVPAAHAVLLLTP